MKKILILYIVLFIVGFTIGINIGKNHNEMELSQLDEQIYSNVKIDTSQNKPKVLFACNDKEILEIDFDENQIRKLKDYNITNSYSILDFYLSKTNYFNIVSGGFGGYKLRELIKKPKLKISKVSKIRNIVIGTLSTVSGTYLGYNLVAKDIDCSDKRLKDKFESIILDSKKFEQFKKDIIWRLSQNYKLRNIKNDSIISLFALEAKEIIGIDSFKVDFTRTEHGLEIIDNSPNYYKDIIELSETINSDEKITSNQINSVCIALKKRIDFINKYGIKSKDWISTDNSYYNLMLNK